MLHVLLVYQKLIPSAVLCGHAQLSRLAEKGKLEYRHCEVYDVTAEILSWANTVIIIRGALEMDELIARSARKAGKRTVYVLDDDLLNVPGHIESSTFYNSPVTQKHIHRTMKNCICFASPSEALIEKYGSSFSQSALIEEPALPHGTPERQADAPVRICFAGSLDRTKDIETLLSNVLNRLLDIYGDRISVTFFGARPAIVEERGLDYIGYQQNYEDYMSVMSSRGFDIGLAPMLPTPFSRFKHYNKYVEYASYGIVGVFSNVYPYTRAVRDRENGILCDNDEEAWFKALSELIDDRELLLSLRDVCLRETASVYSLDTVADDYYEKLCVCDEEKTSGKVRGFSLLSPGYRLRHFIDRCKAYAKRKLKAALIKLGIMK